MVPPEHISCPFISQRSLVRLSQFRWLSRRRFTQSPNNRLRCRGIVEGVDGDVLAVKSRAGEDVRLRMVGIAKISLFDIKIASFIGTTTVPGPDGSGIAVEVHVFPENMRCAGEGSRPYCRTVRSKPTASASAATGSRRRCEAHRCVMSGLIPGTARCFRWACRRTKIHERNHAGNFFVGAAFARGVVDGRLQA